MAISGVHTKEVVKTKEADVVKEYKEEDQSPVERYKDLTVQGLADILLEELDTLMKSYTVRWWIQINLYIFLFSII